MGGQNIENVTDIAAKSHCRRYISMASPDRTHMQKHVKKLQQQFLLSQLQHIINIDTRKLFYNAHIKSHIDYAPVAWDSCGEVHLKNKTKTKNKKTQLLTSKGRQINPSCSFPIYRAKDEWTWNFKPTATTRLQQGNIYIYYA